jgi:predicted O-linked N-acetylglucosamine transferase (SPINDLY family)
LQLADLVLDTAPYGAARLNAPLFDVVSYTRALESLLSTMWSRHRAGLPRAAIDTVAG